MAPTIVDAARVFARSAALAALSPESAAINTLEARDHQYRTSRFDLTQTQKITLGVIAAYAVGIVIVWNIPYVRGILWPFKMLVIVFHEFGHAITCVLTCGKVEGIKLDPREGGATHMRGGVGAITLPAGYLGSSLIGAACVACGFDVSASKILSFILGAFLIIAMWWGKKDWLTLMTCLLSIAFMVVGWFIAHAVVLRFFILFIGVMSCLYSLWDICDDLIIRKVPSSDASQFQKKYGGSSKFWGLIWGFVSLAFLAAGIIAGIALFPKSWAEQDAASAGFLPT